MLRNTESDESATATSATLLYSLEPRVTGVPLYAQGPNPQLHRQKLEQRDSVHRFPRYGVLRRKGTILTWA
jgi:hypothetical protein